MSRKPMRAPWLLLLLVFAGVSLASFAPKTRAATPYDPLAVAGSPKSAGLDLIVHDAARHRDLPVHLYLPAAAGPAPVVLFSHGLGGSGFESAFLGEHWARRGYVAVFLDHPGSDAAIWQGKDPFDAMNALAEAANLDNFLLRVADVHAVLDQLVAWNQEPAHALHGRLDPDQVGMSGHSFGAITTQAVCGQTLPLRSFTDPRFKAAVIFSPSSPLIGDAKDAFAAVPIPWMLMTGTKDVVPIGHQDMASRLAVFPALPPGHKYQVVLDRGEHSIFIDHPLPLDTEPRNPNHHRVILALSTAFWDAYLRDDPAARAWLDGDGPRTVLEPADRWEKK